MLKGAAVVTVGDVVGFQEGVVDMWGEGAKWTPFSKTYNIVVDIKTVDGLEPHERETVMRLAGLRAAECVGQAAKGVEPDETKVFENKPVDPERHLPRVAYVVTQMASNDSWNFFYYGQSAINFLPIVVQPTEILDGAMIWRYWEPNYYLQEECYIEELLERNGKDLDFAGVVFANNVMKIWG